MKNVKINLVDNRFVRPLCLDKLAYFPRTREEFRIFPCSSLVLSLHQRVHGQLHVRWKVYLNIQ